VVKGKINNAKALLLLPSCTLLLQSLLHKRGTTNDAKAPSSAPPPLSSSSLRKQKAINGVEMPLPLPSHVLLQSPLHKHGETNSAKAPLSSTREQGTANDAEAPCHHGTSRGQLIAPRRYCMGCRLDWMLTAERERAGTADQIFYIRALI
jgi:hypothetical protein